MNLASTTGSTETKTKWKKIVAKFGTCGAPSTVQGYGMEKSKSFYDSQC